MQPYFSHSRCTDPDRSDKQMTPNSNLKQLQADHAFCLLWHRSDAFSTGMKQTVCCSLILLLQQELPGCINRQATDRHFSRVSFEHCSCSLGWVATNRNTQTDGNSYLWWVWWSTIYPPKQFAAWHKLHGVLNFWHIISLIIFRFNNIFTLKQR